MGPAQDDGMPVWKRCGDVGLCMLLLPLFVLTASALLLINPFLNPGALLFSQRRVGLRGHEFSIFKFRTMAGGSAIPRFAPEETARLTPLGGLLRRAHLDELPQIINILRGEMTFVGPRPEQPSFARIYEAELPQYAQRYDVLPGITGLAQLRQGYTSSLDETRIKLRHDLEYIRRFSPRLDLLILGLTLRHALGLRLPTWSLPTLQRTRA